MPDFMRANGYDRVRAHASEVVNARLDRVTAANLDRGAEEPEFARQRLAEIEHEWDLDRAIMVWFAAMGAAALNLGLRRDRRWRFPLSAQIAFLLLHSFVGWCPPASLLRRLGFRTRQEIEAERTGLLAAAAGLSPA
jgi:hypothetical protein